MSLGFFDDVFVPNHYFPDPSFFNEEQGIWFWKYTDGDGTTNDMEIDLEEDLRIRVESVKFLAVPTPEELERARGMALFCSTWYINQLGGVHGS